MADFTQPGLTSLYADMLNVLKDRDTSIIQWLDGTTDSNLPSGAKRWSTSNSYFEKFNGTSWSPLAAKYMIDVDKIDGCTVNDLGISTTDLWTANKINSSLGAKLNASDYTPLDVLTKIKTVDGATSGLDADLLDGLHAASTNTASTVVSRNSSGNFSAGTITANLVGNSSTATKLASTININGVSFDGSVSITVADSTKIPSAGGTLTGALTAIRETKVAMGANNIDLAAGNLFTKTITATTTFTVSNVLANGNANSFILEITNGGSQTITWWSGVKWAGGLIPSLTVSGVDILGFYSHDGGTTWRGMLMAKDSK